MRILMSIPSLERGGAERQFAALAAGLAARGHEVLAVTLDRAGPLAGELGRARLVELMRGAGRNGLGALAALAGLLRREAPQVHYAFLPTCTVRAAMLAPLVPATRLVLGIRATDSARGPNAPRRLAGRLLLELETRLSPLADLVIANSEAARKACVGRGFAPGRLHVVANGVDTARFLPDRERGAALRRQWGVVAGQTLVGVAARLDPHKGHAVFLEAAALASAARPDLRFVCLGGGPQALAAGLRERALALGVADRVAWTGEHADMPAAYNALDMLCLPSERESAPNVLAEGLACGLPCLASRVGDCEGMLGECGLTVAPGDAVALAGGMLALLARREAEGAGLAVRCRARAEDLFSVERMVEETEALFLKTRGAGGRQG